MRYYLLSALCVCVLSNGLIKMAVIAQWKCHALNYLLAWHCTIHCKPTQTVTANQNEACNEIHSDWIKVCNMALHNPSNPNKENKLYRYNFYNFSVYTSYPALLCLAHFLFSFALFSSFFSSTKLRFLKARTLFSIIDCWCNCTCYFLLKCGIFFGWFPTSICVQCAVCTQLRWNWKVQSKIELNSCQLLKYE